MAECGPCPFRLTKKHKRAVRDSTAHCRVEKGAARLPPSDHAPYGAVGFKIFKNARTTGASSSVVYVMYKLADGGLVRIGKKITPGQPILLVVSGIKVTPNPAPTIASSVCGSDASWKIIG